MSNEELMKPRYKVIADYPKSLYHVGDILNGGWGSEDCIYCDTDGPRWRHYPHLFRPLEWWEERKPEDMPQYVKSLGGNSVRTVDHFEMSREKVIFEGGIIRPVYKWHPATIEEYNTYINKNTQP